MCKRAIDSIKRTSEGSVEIMVYVDQTDPQVAAYRDLEPENRLIVGLPRRAGEAIRHMLQLAMGDMFYFGSDDITWETPGWDDLFRRKMPNHDLAVLYPDMGDSCNPCFTRKWVETVGLWPEYFKHFGPDTWYADIAKRAGTLISVPEVRMRHERVRDETYTRTRADGDGMFAQRMLDETREERQQLAEKIRKLSSES
jgi:hypothetical protein